MYNMDNKAVAFVDANGDLIPKVKLEPWTDLYTAPPAQSVQSVKPAPLVRLTEEETINAYMKSSLDVNARIDDLCSFANTLQDAWIAKNGGKV